jgi:hypothetical protein
MKKKFSVFGMLAMVLGFVFIGCDTGNGNNDPMSPSAEYLSEKDWLCTSGDMGTGTTSLTMNFSGTNQWTETFNGGDNDGKTVTGTYTLSGLTITCIITGGTLSSRPANGTAYTATFDAAQATKFTDSQEHIFNRQP